MLCLIRGISESWYTNILHISSIYFFKVEKTNMLSLCNSPSHYLCIFLNATSLLPSILLYVWGRLVFFTFLKINFIECIFSLLSIFNDNLSMIPKFEMKKKYKLHMHVTQIKRDNLYNTPLLFRKAKNTIIRFLTLDVWTWILIRQISVIVLMNCLRRISW